LFVFLFIEVRAIDKDRRESNTAQLAAQRDQNRKFSEILKNNQTEFDATMKRMEGLAKLSKESVDSVTGGRDFVSVEIIPIPVEENGVSLLAVLNGKHAVREVSYSMNEGRPPYIPSQYLLHCRCQVVIPQLPKHPAVVGEG
jgi:hypothetical protein